MKQRSEEWYEARRGRITASAFKIAMMKPDTKGRRVYVQSLVLDLMGVPAFDVDTPWWFQHGIDNEPKACALYELYNQVDVEHVGIVDHPDFHFVSASPDGLVGDDGGIEIKSHQSLTQYNRVRITEQMLPVYKAQVQGNMWVTSRHWWDYVAYHNEDIYVVRVMRDNAYIKKLQAAVLGLWDQVQEELNGRRSQV